MKYIYYLIFLLFLSHIPIIRANQQTFSVIPFDTSDGMGSPVSFSIVKDRYGFIWVSTRRGIDRFDGLHFKSYTLTESDMRMTDDGVRYDLLKNNDNEIFAYSDLGKVFKFDEETDSFIQIHNVKQYLGVHSLHALAINPDILIVGLYNGICIVDRHTNQKTRMLCQDTNIRCIIPFANNTYLIGSEKGLWCLDIARNACELISSPELDVMSLYYDDEQQRVWMGTKGNGLWTLRLDNTEAQQITNYEQTIVTSICTYADSQLLIGTDGSGLLQTSRIFISPLWQLAGTSQNAQNLLPSSAVQEVFEDNNNIWLTTYDCGMILLAPDPMVGMLSLPDTKYASDRYCYDIDRTDNGEIWAAYNRYICRYSDRKSSAEIFLEGQSGFLAVEALSDGSVCAGGYNSGLYRIDSKTKKQQHISSINGANVNSSIYDFCEDNKGNLWIGGHNFPLTCVKHFVGTPVGYIPKAREMVQYEISRICDIAQLNDSTMIVGTVNGFYLIDINTHGTQHIYAEGSELDWGGTTFITCIKPKDQHIIYIGTDGAGFMTYDILSGEVNTYKKDSHQLPSNYIRGIEISGDTMLWISTENRGIFSFDIKRQKVKHRFNNRSLQSDEFLGHSCITLPDGNVVFGGKGGIETIMALEMPNSEPKINIYLSEVGIGQESRISYVSRPDILDSRIQETTHIRLPYNEKSLRLSFTTDDIYNQSDLLMMFKLDGGPSNWVPMNEQRSLHYYTLPVGKHELKVRCLTSNGQTIDKTFIIEAMQTPWLCWHALLCYVLLLSAIAYFIVMFYKKHVESNAAEEKIRFFDNIAHDIQTPLSLVHAPLYELEQYISPDAPDNLMPLVKHNLNHLTNIVNQLLMFNTNQNGTQTLNLKPIPLCKMAKAIIEAYQPLAKKQKLELEAFIPEEEEIWILADVIALTRVADNILGNAFKFTKTGKISLTVRSRGHNGQLEVRDTGIGMSESTRRKLFLHFMRGENALKEKVSGFGLGMAYSYQALRKMNGRISCQSQIGKGSSFTVSLPLTTGIESESYCINRDVLVASTTSIDTKSLYSSYRHNILIVEDDTEMLNYLSEKLSHGYNVSVATNVEDAKEQLNKNSTDLIISDVMMQGMKGDEWCQELKSNFETSHIPVILLTAVSDYQKQIHSLSMGADEYITKPFDINILLIKIHNILDSKRKQNAYYMQTIGSKQKEKLKPKNEKEQEKQYTQRDLDDQFISQLLSVIEKNVSKPNLSVSDIAGEMALSHTLLYERINKLLGIPPATLLRNCRMKRAKELLLQKKLSVAEVALMCGYTDPKNFSTTFKKHYGCPPSKIDCTD